MEVSDPYSMASQEIMVGGFNPAENCSASTEVTDQTGLEVDDEPLSEDEARARQVVDLLYDADADEQCSSSELSARVRDALAYSSWTGELARCVLRDLADRIARREEDMPDALRAVHDQAVEAARECGILIQDQPVLCGTVIALGVLVVLMPWVVEAIGFSESGPVPDSYAAWWQIQYGTIPADSLYDYFQMMGMAWGRY